MNIKHSIDKEVFYEGECALTRGIDFLNYSIDLHDHTYHEINVILSGKGKHRIENRTFDAAQGDVFVIPPKIKHSYNSESDFFNVFHIIIKNSFFEKCEESLKRFSGFLMLFEIEPFLRLNNQKAFLHLEKDELEYLRKLLYSYKSVQEVRSDENDILASLEVFKIIAFLSTKMSLSAFTEQRAGEYFSASISKAISFIHTNPSEKITIDSLSALCNMSRATFIRQFKRATGTTPSKYLTEYRIKTAKKMLELGKTKTAVAHECGFYDVSHMEKTILKRESNR